MCTLRRWLNHELAPPILSALAMLLAVTLLPLPNDAWLSLGLLAGTTRTRALRDILAEAKGLQDKYRGQAMPEDEARKFEALCAEAKAYQDEDDREAALQRIDDLEKKGRRAVDPALPNMDGRDDPNANVPENAKSVVAGYVRLGDFIRLSGGFKKFLERGMPEAGLKLSVPNLLDIKGWSRGGFVPMTREERNAFTEFQRESKSLPVFGTRVIEPDRLTDIVEDTVNDRLRLRDILNVVPTTSNLIEWIAKTAFTRAADIVSDGDAKPEAAASFELRSTSVKTIAVWIPVTEQQLQDAPALINLIQNDLRYDVGKVEEEQVMWATGAGQDLDGLVNNITAGRTVGGDTTFDKIRRAITDVIVSGYSPNGMAMHPIDWEDIQLLKGSDNHYIWMVTTDSSTGVSRIWGLRVVETVACLNPAATDRKIIVGDWARGATLYDRMQAAIAIGYKDDDFIRNLRTIRAEERVAFAVRRPDAFRYIDTL